MAKNKKKNKKADKKKKGKKKLKLSFSFVMLSLIFLIFAILYLPMAILLFIGMLPTIVIYFTDKRPGRNKTFTIGAMNFAGCFYYLLEVWTQPYPFDAAMQYVSQPMTIVIIYTAALMGYLINYVTTISVASILRQKSQVRLEKLEDKKKSLEKRWGEKVNGGRPLDSNGFPIENG